jgi:transposase
VIHANTRAAIIRWRKQGWRIDTIAERFGVSEEEILKATNARKRKAWERKKSRSATCCSARSYLRKAFSQGF